MRYIATTALCAGLIISLRTDANEYSTAGFEKDPYTFQVDQQTTQLGADKGSDREAAVENLSTLRAYDAAGKVATFLKDPDSTVRREAAMNLGWTGNSDSLEFLVRALDDDDWTVRQAAAISLTNLTAHTLEFDALAKDEVRSTQVVAWSEFIKSFQPESLISQLARTKSIFEKGDVVRAIGFMKVRQAESQIIELTKPYLAKEVDKHSKESTIMSSRPEKIFIQACIRTLGLLGGDDSKHLLIKFLDVPQWASYAADALGDIGGEDVAAALIQNYNDYAIGIKNRAAHRSDYKKVIKKVHNSDQPNKSCVDRIPRVAHMILQSLSRIDFESEKNIKALRVIVPNIIATMPSDFDSTTIYELEPYQMIAAHLLEKSGLRQAAVNAAFIALKVGNRTIDDSIVEKSKLLDVADDNVQSKTSKNMPYAGTILMACCRDKADIPLLIGLLSHKHGWVKIHAAKTLMFMEAQEAVPVLIGLLEQAKDDADYGYDMDFRRFGQNNIKKSKTQKLPGAGFDEYNDPSPRHKEAFIMALGGMKAKEATEVLIKYLNNDRNVAEAQYTAAKALYQIATPDALEALRIAEARHPFESVRQVAREAVWLYELKKMEEASSPKTRKLKQLPVPVGKPKEIVFIKGVMDPGNHEQISSDKSGYSSTDGGPTYRLGNNIFRCKTADPENSLVQLTNFTEGFVADIEVSYDGKRILFAYRGPGEGKDANPWWHVYEMNADGSEMRQITDGPYHDVQPNYMPDGRIVFSTSRLGVRDEYHGYAATGLAVMNDDGSDIHLIGFNLGRDSEPVVGDDGKILFSRLELFYSRLKTEWNLLTAFPDGTKPVTLYGPERRDFWKSIKGAGAISPPRHRTLRITQPQSWSNSQYLINSFSGPMLTGPGHMTEKILRPNNEWGVTTPYKVDDNTLLVAAGKRPMYPPAPKNNNKSKKKKRKVKTGINDFAAVDHGIYYMDVKTGDLTLIYNDPNTSDFEARPLQPRKIPLVLNEGPFTRRRDFTGTVLCNSIYTTRIDHVKQRGKYIRIVEGVPTVARHQTHMNGGIAWRNHGGAIGRDLGIVPVATDGSFSIEVPSDRLFHIQVLDSDRNVVGNELLWQYVRPGEAKSCVGCHEKPDGTPVARRTFPKAHRQKALKCLPNENDMLYRAKMWFKGWAPDEREERMHTVNSINLIGRQ